jgi:hypothetical protein
MTFTLKPPKIGPKGLKKGFGLNKGAKKLSTGSKPRTPAQQAQFEKARELAWAKSKGTGHSLLGNHKQK